MGMVGGSQEHEDDGEDEEDRIVSTHNFNTPSAGQLYPPALAMTPGSSTPNAQYGWIIVGVGSPLRREWILSEENDEKEIGKAGLDSYSAPLSLSMPMPTASQLKSEFPLRIWRGRALRISNTFENLAPYLQDRGGGCGLGREWGDREGGGEGGGLPAPPGPAAVREAGWGDFLGVVEDVAGIGEENRDEGEFDAREEDGCTSPTSSTGTVRPTPSLSASYAPVNSPPPPSYNFGSLRQDPGPSSIHFDPVSIILNDLQAISQQISKISLNLDSLRSEVRTLHHSIQNISTHLHLAVPRTVRNKIGECEVRRNDEEGKSEGKEDWEWGGRLRSDGLVIGQKQTATDAELRRKDGGGGEDNGARREGKLGRTS
ncbi:MAG: hypothetical protein M1827_005660 [Pycnora praestabilis]|nr:MAG: hypothetical protein M1827_005660 [Pycnora praestabilis]